MTVGTTTFGDAWNGLTGRNQLVLDGIVGAVLASGALQVNVGRGVVTAGAITNQVFRAGDRVRLMATTERTYIVTGRATVGGRAQTRTLPVPPPIPSSAQYAATLHDAFMQVVVKQNQLLRRGVVSAILSDGTLHVTMTGRGGSGGPTPARASTNHRFRAGEIVYGLKADDGRWLVAGPFDR